jgi:hypothetical protein
MDEIGFGACDGVELAVSGAAGADGALARVPGVMKGVVIVDAPPGAAEANTGTEEAMFALAAAGALVTPKCEAVTMPTTQSVAATIAPTASCRVDIRRRRATSGKLAPTPIVRATRLQGCVANDRVNAKVCGTPPGTIVGAASA